MEKLDAKIYFNGEGHQIGNPGHSGFLKSYQFQDEYEANLAWAIYLQYSKLTKSMTSFFDYQWILKAVFRVIGIESKWSK